MSIEREFRRRAMRANGMRTTCRHCKEKLVLKPYYGWVCPACGWEPSAQVNSREKIEEEQK